MFECFRSNTINNRYHLYYEKLSKKDFISFFLGRYIKLFFLFLILIGLYYFHIFLKNDDTIYWDTIIFIAFFIISLSLMEEMFFLLLIPIVLRPLIYINYSYKAISFSQKDIVKKIQSERRIVFFFTKMAYGDDNNNKFRDHAIAYTYYELIKDSRIFPKKFVIFFGLIALYFIIVFILVLIFQFHIVEHFSKYNIGSEKLFFISILPIIIYSTITLKIILEKETYYKSMWKASADEATLVDYRIDNTYLSIYRSDQANAYELTLILNIIVAIYLTISIPLVYNRVYIDTVRVDNIPRFITNIKIIGDR